MVRPRARRFADQFETIGADRVSVESGQARIDVNGNGSVDAEFGDPDFTYVSFISNMVLRWEYGLGSTLFLVWQHGRSDRGSGGQFGLGRSLDDLLAAQGENVFVIKFNYWLNP